jgi:predicted O-methyltransferase YrrM
MGTMIFGRLRNRVMIMAGLKKSMGKELWTEVDGYVGRALVREDAELASVAGVNADAGLPSIDVSPPHGKMLQLFARMVGARSILEIGTLGGYSTVWLARALPQGGRVTTLEIDAKHAEVARANLRRCGVADRVDVRVGPALETLQKLEQEGAGPFDLIFIDADKPNNPKYLKYAIALCRPGGVIIGDNVVRSGDVANPRSKDEAVIGTRQFLEDMGKHPRLTTTAIQTVGTKGYDGFALAFVLPP